MKNILIITGAVVVCAVLSLIAFFGYLGMFNKMTVLEKEMGPFTHVYESFKGPYPETGKVFDKVYNELKALNIDTTQGLGVYYDNPAEVAKEELRSDCGVVLQEKDEDKLEQLKQAFNVKVLEQKESIVTVFPIKSGLSYMMGPMKAYPALTRYAEKNNFKIILTYELYDQPNNQILFVVNIEKK